MSREYTPEEMRYVASNLLDAYVNDDNYHKSDIEAMLRQAAEMRERCETTLAGAETRSKLLQCDECPVHYAKRGYDDRCSLCDGQCRAPEYDLDCLKADLDYIIHGN